MNNYKLIYIYELDTKLFETKFLTLYFLLLNISQKEK